MKKSLVLLVLVVLAAGCAFAGPSGSPDFTNPVTVGLLGFSGGLWQNGYPYSLAVTGVGAPVLAMCDDYLHGGQIGESWTANVTELGSNNVTLTRFGHMETAIGLARYRQAGWILLQTPITSSSEYMDMNYAVWHIFDPAVPLDPGAQFWLDAARAEAARGFPGVPFNEVFILTPVDQYDPNLNDPQEFLTIDPRLGSPSGTTPEPGTLLLLATGIVGAWKRKLLMWR